MSRTPRRLLPLLSLAAIAFSNSAAGAEEAPHWTYEGEAGPEHWGEIDEAYALCADGSAQTPIDIVTVTIADLPDPSFSYDSGPVAIVNNGHTVQAVSAEGNSIAVGDATADLLQMHYHTPSEHTINGQVAPAEVHFVHKDAMDALTVVGVMLVEGPDVNAAWAPFIDSLGTEVGTDAEATLDWAALLPADRTTVRYEGSLTTPPCSEGVHWLLMQEPVALSADQIARLSGAYAGNARPVQAINDREVTLDWAAG